MNLKDIDNGRQLSQLDKNYKDMLSNLDSSINQEEELSSLVSYHSEILNSKKKTVVKLDDTEYMLGVSMSTDESGKDIIVLVAYDYTKAKLALNNYVPAIAKNEYDTSQTQLDNIKTVLEGWLRYKMDIILPEEL